MCAVYAFARRIDDIGDGRWTRTVSCALLGEQDEAVAAARPRPAPTLPTAIP